MPATQANQPFFRKKIDMETWQSSSCFVERKPYAVDVVDQLFSRHQTQFKMVENAWVAARCRFFSRAFSTCRNRKTPIMGESADPCNRSLTILSTQIR